jgi:hypothetical protein
MEQRQEIEELVRQVQELEDVRKRQAGKIGALKEESYVHESSFNEKNVVADDIVAVSFIGGGNRSTRRTRHHEKMIEIPLKF